MRDSEGIVHFFAFGGLTELGMNNYLYSFNSRTWIWTLLPNNGVQISPRMSANMVAHNGFLYLFGGMYYSTSIDETKTYKYDFSAGGWSIVTNSGPSARGYAGTTLLDDTIYLFYGWDGTNQLHGIM